MLTWVLREILDDSISGNKIHGGYISGLDGLEVLSGGSGALINKGSLNNVTIGYSVPGFGGFTSILVTGGSSYVRLYDIILGKELVNIYGDGAAGSSISMSDNGVVKTLLNSKTRSYLINSLVIGGTIQHSVDALTVYGNIYSSTIIASAGYVTGQYGDFTDVYFDNSPNVNLSLSSFYTSYLAIKSKVDSFSASLSSLTADMIADLANIGSYVVNAQAWSNLSNSRTESIGTQAWTNLGRSNSVDISEVQWWKVASMLASDEVVAEDVDVLVGGLNPGAGIVKCKIRAIRHGDHVTLTVENLIAMNTTGLNGLIINLSNVTELSTFLPTRVKLEYLPISNVNYWECHASNGDNVWGECLMGFNRLGSADTYLTFSKKQDGNLFPVTDFDITANVQYLFANAVISYITTSSVDADTTLYTRFLGAP